jgi:hypothetical protein
VLKAAVPAVKVAVPITVWPSRNCTLAPLEAGVTVAVKVTEAGVTDGFKLLARVIDGAVFATVSVRAVEVLPECVASPRYAAVMVCVPAVKVEVPKLAVPVPVTEPITDPPSRNCMVPAAALGVMVAVN